MYTNFSLFCLHALNYELLNLKLHSYHLKNPYPYVFQSLNLKSAPKQKLTSSN